METVRISVDLEKGSRPFRHFYNAVGYANADYTYTEPSRVMFDYLSSYHNHFRYMRVHNILTAHGKGDYYIEQCGSDYGNPPDDPETGLPAEEHWDSVVWLEDDGTLRFDWTVVDRVYNIFRDHGMIPIVETCWLPTCLAKSRSENHIPKDLRLWHKVIRQFVLHVRERYGAENVSKWYFEVWNEPNQKPVWAKDPSSFFAMYDYLEDAVHSVDPSIRTGGPAVMQDGVSEEIFRKFLDHCTGGVNYVTGAFGTRLDFISVHCKGGWFGNTNPSSEVMFRSVRRYLEILKEYPSLKDAEFFNDESDIVWDGNLGIWHRSWLNFRNTHYPPGFICKMIQTYTDLVEDEFGMNLGIVDSDNCHIHWEKYLFSGNRSQLTPLVKRGSTDLVKKSIFNAYVLMSRLGNERLRVSCGDADYGTKFGVLPTRDGNILSLMCWNFEDGMDDDVNPRRFHLDLSHTGLSGSYRLVHWRIDREHSNAYGVWSGMGKPEDPSKEQVALMREHEGLELLEPVKNIRMEDSLTLSVDLPMHAVSLLLLVPENDVPPAQVTGLQAKCVRSFLGEPQAFLTWTPSPEKDFLFYRVLRKEKDAPQDAWLTVSKDCVLNTALFIDSDVQKGRSYEYRVQAVSASMAAGTLCAPTNLNVL
ncbi:MAG: hypothetical protein IKS34_01560 [Clostridia bacterium]|nr:hypothetical protein [Clostridia bacterium]